MPIDYGILHDELHNDPDGLGYQHQIDINSWNGVMLLLNTPDPKRIPIRHEPITSSYFAASIRASEWVTLNSAQLQQVTIYVTAGSIDIGDDDVQLWVTQIWPSGTTHDNLTKLATRIPTPLEALFGPGTIITDSNDAIRAYKEGK